MASALNLGGGAVAIEFALVQHVSMRARRGS